MMIRLFPLEQPKLRDQLPRMDDNGFLEQTLEALRQKECDHIPSPTILTAAHAVASTCAQGAQ